MLPSESEREARETFEEVKHIVVGLREYKGLDVAIEAGTHMVKERYKSARLTNHWTFPTMMHALKNNILLINT